MFNLNSCVIGMPYLNLKLIDDKYYHINKVLKTIQVRSRY